MVKSTTTDTIAGSSKQGFGIYTEMLWFVLKAKKIHGLSRKTEIIFPLLGHLEANTNLVLPLICTFLPMRNIMLNFSEYRINILFKFFNLYASSIILNDT